MTWIRFRRIFRRVWCFLLGGHEWGYWHDDARACRRGCGATEFDGYWRRHKRWNW